MIRFQHIFPLSFAYVRDGLFVGYTNRLSCEPQGIPKTLVVCHKYSLPLRMEVLVNGMCFCHKHSLPLRMEVLVNGVCFCHKYSLP